jgi:hypothetical protein
MAPILRFGAQRWRHFCLEGNLSMKSQHLSRTSDGLSRTSESTLRPHSAILISCRLTDVSSISKSLYTYGVNGTKYKVQSPQHLLAQYDCWSCDWDREINMHALFCVSNLIIDNWMHPWSLLLYPSLYPIHYLTMTVSKREAAVKDNYAVCQGQAIT